MKKSLDYIVRLEKAIKQKYGADAIQNPAKYWNEEKEKDYLAQLKDFVKKQKYIEDGESKVEVGGFLINKKLLTRVIKINCPVCSKRCRTIRDDIYMNKSECCEKCYYDYVHGREERWLEGWRPENVTDNT